MIWCLYCESFHIKVLKNQQKFRLESKNSTWLTYFQLPIEQSPSQEDSGTLEPQTIELWRLNPDLWTPIAKRNFRTLDFWTLVFRTQTFEPWTFEPQVPNELLNPRHLNPGLLNPKLKMNFWTPDFWTLDFWTPDLWTPSQKRTFEPWTFELQV